MCINDLLDALGQTFAETLHIKVRSWGAFPKVHLEGKQLPNSLYSGLGNPLASLNWSAL